MGVRSGPKIHNVHSKPDHYTKLLIHGGGADGTQVFTDYSRYGHAISYYGNAQWEASDAAGIHFHGSTIEFDGTDDYLSVANHTDFAFGANDFTIEAWIYPTDASQNEQTIFAKDFTTDHGWIFNFVTGSGNGYDQIGFVHSTNGSSWASATRFTSGVSANSWYHIAAVRSGTTITIYVNGSSVGSYTGVGALYADGAAFLIGAYQSGSVSGEFDGYIDEVRVSHGIARYTENFTPSGPFNVNSLVLCLDSTGGYRTGPELLTSGTSGQRAATYGYHQAGDIFDNATMTGFHAKHASSGQANAGSPVTLPLVLGKTYRVRFDCNIISGTGSGRPNFNLSRHYNYGSMTGDKVNRYRVQEGSDPYYVSSCVQGKNEFIVTVTENPTWGNSCIQFVTFGAQEYTISNMSVKELFPYNDLSGTGNNGTPAADAILAVEGYVSATVWPNPTTPRHVLDFDGTGDYVDVGDVNKGLGNGSRFAKAGTMCIWLKPENIASNDYVWQKNDKSGSTTYAICKAYSTNRMMFRLYGDWGWSPAVYTNATDTFGAGWHHLVTRWYPNGLDIWKDGNHHDSAVESGTWGGAGANTIRFGNNSSNDGGNGWDGQMACIQLYDVALNHQQIKDLYNSQKSRFGK